MRIEPLRVIVAELGDFMKDEAINAVQGKVEALRKAMLGNNRQELDDLFASGLTWGHSTAHVESRSECLENLAQKVFVFPTLEFSRFDYVHEHGAVIVRHRMEADTAHQNEALGHVDISVILVWVNVAGDWELLARQACKNP